MFQCVRSLIKEYAHLSETVPVWVRLERHGLPERYHPVPEQLAHVARYDSGVLRIPMHKHDFFEIALVLGGDFTHLTEAGARTLASGTAIIVPRGAVHGYEMASDMTIINLFYIGEWLATDLPELWRNPIMMQLFLAGALIEAPRHRETFIVTLKEGLMRRALWELADLGEQLQSSPPNVLYIRSCVMKYLSLLGEAYAVQCPDTPIGAFRKEILFVLKDVERRLKDGDRVDVRCLADACGLNTQHLSRLFRKTVGLTVMQYFQKRRVQLACRMLAGGKTSPTEIAHSLAFSDYSHFRRQFSRYMGVTPKEYMKDVPRS